MTTARARLGKIACAHHDRAMRVTEDHDVGVVASQHLLRRRPAKFVPMADVDGDPADRHHAFARERRVVRIVTVPVHGVHWRDLRQDLEHRSPADVACVENPFHALERSDDPRADLPVRVGDESDDVDGNRESGFGLRQSRSAFLIWNAGQIVGRDSDCWRIL